MSNDSPKQASTEEITSGQLETLNLLVLDCLTNGPLDQARVEGLCAPAYEHAEVAVALEALRVGGRIFAVTDGSTTAWQLETRLAQAMSACRADGRLPEAAQLTAQSSEWYSPAIYVEAARVAMGGIDFDPCSCPLAQTIVQATDFCGLPADGLARSYWGPRVWMNPPSPPRNWFADLLRRHRSSSTDDCEQAVYMAYSIEQLSQLQRFCDLGDYRICVPAKRIRYLSPQSDGSLKPGGSPTHASALIGLGFDRAQWATAFGPLGACW